MKEGGNGHGKRNSIHTTVQGGCRPIQGRASRTILLNISISALKAWTKKSRENEGKVPTRGAGNYSSDEAKEIARLQRELRDTKDALEVLKKAIGILGN